MARLRSLVKKKKRSVLNKIVDFFSHSSYKAYFVGGIIRDTILKRDAKDVDIIIEGNVEKAASELNTLLNGKLQRHKDFGTIAIYKDNMRFDLAMARKEIYRTPGALPIVSKANIDEDLKRRDFTINAIALSISKNTCGQILDPFDGIGDIKNGLIRILHKKSFLDDPTRIFRALRYKNQLGFRLESNTEKLLNDAISKGMLERISKQRIMNELKLIFTEKSYKKTLRDLKKYHIVEFSARALKKIEAMGDLKYYYFLNLIGTEDLPLSNQEKRIINDLKKLNKLKRAIKMAKTNSEIFFLLSEIDEKVLNVIQTLDPELKQKIRLYRSLRKIKPLVNGKDLIKIGIKQDSNFKKILSRLYRLQLDGKINDKKTALSLIRNV
ncbi:MAG: CCA tRNA nucleotidyltransferase [bacterium]